MAAPRYKIDIPGGSQEVVAAAIGGAGAIEKIVSTNTSGVLDPSFFPAGIGTDTVTVPASEALASGDMVNLWTNAGATNARKADGSVANGGKACDGFVLDAVASGQPALVYRNGLNSSKTGLSPGAIYYLAATAGGITTTYPNTSGQTRQIVGKAITATSIDIQPQPFTGIA